MRVSKDPNDEAYSDIANKRRVWSRDQEVTDWLTADEFRRVVITMSGRVLNGACRIERIAEDAPLPDPVKIVEPPVNTGFVGLGLVHVPDKPKSAPAPAPVPVPADPQTELPLEATSPGLPDTVVDELHSERLPDNEFQE